MPSTCEDGWERCGETSPSDRGRRMAEALDRLAAVGGSGIGAPATWVLSNHDVTRPATRYGRADTAFAFDTKRFGTPTDLDKVTSVEAYGANGSLIVQFFSIIG